MAPILINTGALAEETYHAIILLTSTVGFPNVMAALSWAGDVIENLKSVEPHNWLKISGCLGHGLGICRNKS